MTTENELIRYPVALRDADRNYTWLAVVDAAGGILVECRSTNRHDRDRAAEIVRVLNAYHKSESQPAPVSGEPSPQAMRIATKWIVSGDKSAIRELASGCDIEFAAERAEAAELVRKWINLNQITERERDEAVRCGLNEWNRALIAEARVKELESELARVTRIATNSSELQQSTIAQLRADLDEAVGLLGNGGTNFHEWFAKKSTFLARLSKPSELGNCSGVPIWSDSDAEELRQARTGTGNPKLGLSETPGPRAETITAPPEPATEKPAHPEMALPKFPFDDETATESGDGTYGQLRQQLAERDAEIETWKKRDRIKDEQLKTSGRRAKQWRRRCWLAEAHRASVVELESALRQEEGEAAEQASRN